MHKKHDYAALLKYMRMLEEGVSYSRIRKEYGISYGRLSRLWLLYQQHGTSVLRSKHYTQVSGELKQQVVRDIQENNLTLVQASLKYGVSVSRLDVLLKISREQGIDALLITKKRGRPPCMGRPRKKKPEEMTELERLRRENHLLKLELEIRKKAQALVEERKARLRAIGQGQSEN